MVDDLVAIARVAHDENGIRTTTIDDQVVQDATVFLAAAGVHGLTVLDASEVVGDEAVYCRDGVTADLEFPHV